MKEFTIEMARETFTTDEVWKAYHNYINDLLDLEESLDNVNTPYAILMWWSRTEFDIKGWYDNADYQMKPMEFIMLAAVLENEVEMVLHKHFTDDVIAEYRKMFAQDGLMRLRDAIYRVNGY